MKKYSMASLVILFVALGIPTIFILFSGLTNTLAETSPYIMIAVIIIASTANQIRTVRLTYSFLNLKTPKLGYIPFIGETALLDDKYKNITLVFYVLTVISIAVMFIPVGYGSLLPADFPKFCTYFSVVFIAIIQIVKGLGILQMFMFIDKQYREITGYSISLKVFLPLSFFPFVRNFVFIVLCRPLGAMVEFQHLNIASTKSANFEEKE